jgi:hypothetical protein
MINTAFKQEEGYDTLIATQSQPRLIQFPTHGDKMRGFLSVSENTNLPFAVKHLRILTFISLPTKVAHRVYPEQILISIEGQIEFEPKTLSNKDEQVRLVANETNLGIYLPENTRGCLSFSSNAVVLQLVRG